MFIYESKTRANSGVVVKQSAENCSPSSEGSKYMLCSLNGLSTGAPTKKMHNLNPINVQMLIKSNQEKLVIAQTA